MATEPQLPTAEILLSVRTPMELAIAPDGSRIAFALHETVADAGSFVPGDVFVTQAWFDRYLRDSG